jgi:Lrp/AsnC family transcriptional regulator, leucine-responsive regulatory protein
LHLNSACWVILDQLLRLWRWNVTDLSTGELRMLAVIQENHVTNVELAERLGMAPSPCLRRMKALKDQGYIERTVSILNRRKLGFEILAQVEIKVMQIPGRAVDEEFRRAVAREAPVISCYVVSGWADFVLKVVAPSMEEYSRYARTVLVRMPGVQDMRSSFVLESVKDSTALPLESLRRQLRGNAG